MKYRFYDPIPPTPAEFARCRWDVERWAWVYLGIRLHKGQRRMANAYLQRTKSRWRALYLWILVAAGNRAGKTLGLAIIILHSCVYRMGLQPPDVTDERAVERWVSIPYHWWHFAVEQGPAEQVFTEIRDIFKGEHAAQKFGCPWAELVGGFEKIVLLSDANGPKERGEYAWIKLQPEFGGAEIHFRSTKAKALGAIGQNMHGVSFDEAGLEANLETLVKEVLHARRLGTGGQFILISTASVVTSQDFEDLWMTGDPEDSAHEPRRFSMSMSSRENIGYGLDNESFEALISGMDESWILQNIEGKFIQAATVWFNANSIKAAFHEDLPEHQDPVAGRVYIQALDPGLKDKLWSAVFDVLSNGDLVGVHIERIVGKQTTRGIVALGVRNHKMYEMGGKAIIETGVDTTALGGHMFRDLLEEHIVVKSVEFGGQTKVKRQMLSDARTFFDEGRIRMPASGYWLEARRQHINYKLLDRKIEQDLVMAVAIAVKLSRAASRPGAGRSSVFVYGAPEGPKKNVDGITSQTIRAAMAEKRRRLALTPDSDTR